tara:strand:- start:29 stop:214 length:186 start_codon:yes stop_codon:yes gene_type:complete
MERFPKWMKIVPRGLATVLLFAILFREIDFNDVLFRLKILQLDQLLFSLGLIFLTLTQWPE